MASETTNELRISPKGIGRAMWLPVVVGTVVVLAIGGWGIYASLLQWRAARYFETTQGEVISSNITEESGSGDSRGRTYYFFKIKYRYEVEGKTHRCDRYAFGMGGTNDYGYIRGLLDKHPAGKKVTVYYDPDDPDTAVLFIGLTDMHRLLLIIPIPFASLTLLGLIFCLRSRRRVRHTREFLDGSTRLPWRIPTWGILAEDATGMHIKRKLSAVSLIMFFLGTFGFLLPGVLALMVLLIKDSGVDNETVLQSLGIAAGVSLILAIWGWLANGAGAKVTIDTDRNVLTVNGRRHKSQIKLGSENTWILRNAPDPKTVNMKPKALLLAVVDADGVETPVHLFGERKGGPEIGRRAAEGIAELTRIPLEHRSDSLPQYEITAGIGKANARKRRGYAKNMADLT